MPIFPPFPKRLTLPLSASGSLRTAVLTDCVRKGIPSAHILSSGFKELGTPEGLKLEEEVRRVAFAGRLNVIGPNCMGPYVPASV